MQTDLYTKVVLSVIAVCLVWICLNGVTPTVAAQAGPARPSPVIIVDDQGQALIGAQGLRVNSGNQPLPVSINQPVPVTVNQTLPVALTAIERRGGWDPIKVDVLRPPPTLMPTP